ncbi:MAG: uroporphyrinogen-III synthase [Flavobacteriaceae bacterium]|nr:uroporphyrinogen-III synthase [Flavobacteriaceae bacterium]
MEQKSTILFTKKLTEKQKKSLAVPIDDFDFITIKPLDFECHLSPSQTLVFTSQNAVKQVLKKIHIPLQQLIFVVGNKTKKMLLDYADFENIKQPTHETARGIIQLIEEQNANDFLYFCGKKRLPTLENYLNKNGKKHQVIEVYDTCLTPTLKLYVERYRYICFCSPSAVESFVSTYKLTDKQQCICIGETTAKALRSYTKNIEIAPKSSVESMLEMINSKI